MTYDPGYGGQPGGQQFQFYDNPPAPPAPPEPVPAYLPAPPAYPGAGNLTGQHDPGPRPQTVTIAVVLTFAGIGLAFVAILMGYLAASDLHPVTADNPLVDDRVRANSTATDLLSIMISVVGNLTAGAGAGVCAVFALRGSNGARIALAVLCGVFSVWKLACGGFGLLGVRMASQLEVPGYRAGFGYAAAGLDLVLMLLAITIALLLLVGPSNQFFAKPAPAAYLPDR
jgi:hypothetical protein